MSAGRDNSEALRRLVLEVLEHGAAHPHEAQMVGTRTDVARQAAAVAEEMLWLGFRLGSNLRDNGAEERTSAILTVGLEAYINGGRKSASILTLV